MRIAAVAMFVVVLVLAFAAQPTTPAAGETVPPTATPCAGDCGPIITPRPTSSVTPTPDPGCTDDCGPIITPRPTFGTPGPTATPNPACPEGSCFPFPTPRPTFEPGAPVEPAQPGPGPGIWFYSFLPIAHD